MDASSGRTLGIIAIIVLVLLLAWPIKYLLFAPVGIVHGLTNGFRIHHVDGDWVWAWPWIGLAGLFGLALLAVWILILIWVYKDAEKRGMSGPIWVLVVFFVHLIGLLIYFIVRSDHPIRASGGASPTAAPAAPASGDSCPKCGKPADKDHVYCPACGEALKKTCPKCKREVQREWKACPNCGQKL